jgi:hypothetical protein
MTRSEIVAAALVWMVVGCAPREQTALRTQLTEVERRIIATVFADRVNDYCQDTASQFFIRTTWQVPDSFIDRAQREIPDLRSDVVSDFKIQNERPIPLRKEDLWSCAQIADFDSLAHLKQTALKQGNLDNVPGWFSLSRIGLSADQQQALIHVSAQCGLSLCGASFFVLLERTGEHWAVTYELMTTVS